MNMRKMNMSIGKEKFIALMNKNVTFISLQISNLVFDKWQESLHFQIKTDVIHSHSIQWNTC